MGRELFGVGRDGVKGFESLLNADRRMRTALEKRGASFCGLRVDSTQLRELVMSVVACTQANLLVVDDVDDFDVQVLC